MIPYELIVPSAARPHLLSAALMSLLGRVDQSPIRIILHDDAAFPGRGEETRRVAETIARSQLVPLVFAHDDPPIMHGPSLHWLLSQVQTEYVLYSQDDLLVVRDLPIVDALETMHRHNLHQIRFNKRPTMEYKAGWRKKQVNFFRDDIHQTLTTADHWYFQTGLWRVSRIKPVVDWWIMATGKSFAEHCVVGTTLVDTPRGQVAIQDLAAGLRGAEIYLYAYDRKKTRFVLARGKDFRLTQKQALVWKLTCEDGTYLLATPDHKVMLSNGRFKQLATLLPGDSLMPLYRSYKTLLLGDGKETHEHRFVATELFGNAAVRGRDVHHRNRVRTDNDPSNLEVLSRSEHALRDPEKRARAQAASKIAMKKYWADPEWRAKMPQLDPAWQRRKARRSKKKARAFWRKVRRDDPERWQRRLEQLKKSSELRWSLPGARERQRAAMVRSGFWPKGNDESASNHKVVSVEPWGVADVFNLEVPAHHNFVANGLVVHNCEPKVNKAMNREIGEFNHWALANGYALPEQACYAMDPDVRMTVQKTFIWGAIGTDRFVDNLGANPDDWALVRPRGGTGPARVDSQAREA